MSIPEHIAYAPYYMVYIACSFDSNRINVVLILKFVRKENVVIRYFNDRHA